MNPRMGVWRMPRTPRTLRLEQDHRDMLELRGQSTILEFTTEDDPPEKYRLVFRGRSLVPKAEGTVGLGDRQEAEIRLGGEYPRQGPGVRWLTPILHPNISGGNVCLGNFGAFWTPFVKLSQLVEVLWDMARLKILNPYHSYDRRPEAWTELDKRFKFPVDDRPLRDRVLERDAPSSILNPEPSDPGDIVILDDDAGVCG